MSSIENVPPSRALSPAYRISANEPESYWTKLKEGGKSKWVRLPRNRISGKKIEVSKRYWSKSIAFVTFRKQTRGPLASRGDPIELLPIDHPNAIVAGRRFRVQTLVDGKALSGGTLKVYSEASEGHDPTFKVKTGADGRAQLRFPEPGRYLIGVTHEIPASNDPKADAYSYSVFLMLEALAPKKAK